MNTNMNTNMNMDMVRDNNRVTVKFEYNNCNREFHIHSYEHEYGNEHGYG